MKRSEFIDEAYHRANESGKIDDELAIRFYLSMFEDMGMLPPDQYASVGEHRFEWEDEDD